jgi:3-hydroxyisobutyrate dehydrogenase-like beta-hydroxyacid dehydrogenase
LNAPVTRVGFIGLGSQGAGMARRLIDCGLPTTVWARRSAALNPFRAGATVAADPAALGAASDVVGICVTDGAAVRAVVLGDRGVLAGLAPGAVLAVHSTIGPDECEAIADAAAARDVSVVDAPVSGGGAMAAAGRLTVYVGGDDDAVARAMPALTTYGDPVFHLGALGAGLRTKLVNNALVAAHFALAHDAVESGVALGIDRDRLGEALRHGSSRSYALEVFCGLGSLDGVAQTAGAIMAKDIDLFAAANAEPGNRAALLAAADRFLALVGQPPVGAGGSA